LPLANAKDQFIYKNDALYDVALLANLITAFIEYRQSAGSVIAWLVVSLI